MSNPLYECVSFTESPDKDGWYVIFYGSEIPDTMWYDNENGWDIVDRPGKPTHWLKPHDQSGVEGLFIKKDIKLNSGIESDSKIECDALTDSDIECIAYLLSKRLKFRAVQGVPTGGIRLANEMVKYIDPVDSLPVLICDDVLTTGNSMEKMRRSDNCIGAVIFARGICPSWITPLFSMHPAGERDYTKGGGEGNTYSQSYVDMIQTQRDNSARFYKEQLEKFASKKQEHGGEDDNGDYFKNI